MIQILWIEDDAGFDYSELAARVHRSPNHNLIIAHDIGTAVEMILEETFDVVIVDVQVPPGSDARWAQLFTNTRSEIERQLGDKLGIQFLYSLFELDVDFRVKIENLPSWVKERNRFAIFTVNDRQGLEEHLKALGITIHEQKQAGLPRRFLLELIDRVYQQNGTATVASAEE